MANLNQVELEELKDQYRELMRQYGGTNLAGQQTPDGTYGYYTPDFSYGSYKIPYQDPTYSSGYEYARTIAGGMPFEDVVAPGMSFSPDQPMGYTQADLTPKFVGEGPVPVMPVAPTQGTPVEASYETMPYAPVGTPMPTPFPGIPDYLKGLDFSSLQDLDFSNLPGVKTEEVIEPQQDFFKVDQNLFNFEEIADNIDMDKVAKIDIEKIDIPESVSLFSDILNEPVSAEPVSTPINNSLVNANSSPIKIDESTGNINFFSDASSPLGATQEASNYLTPDQMKSGKVTINYKPVPESERVVGTKSQTKGGVLQYKIETMADGSKRITNKDGSVTIEPAPPPVLQTPAFIQPNIDEIVRPISRKNEFLTQPPGLFQLA